MVDQTRITVDPAIELLEMNKRRGERLWPQVPRTCVNEHYVEAEGCVPPGASAKEWTFLYSDGTVETVTVRKR